MEVSEFKKKVGEIYRVAEEVGSAFGGGGEPSPRPTIPCKFPMIIKRSRRVVFLLTAKLPKLVKTTPPPDLPTSPGGWEKKIEGTKRQ